MRALEPKLFELNPKSVVKVYNTIMDFVDFDKLKSKSDLIKVLNSKSLTIEEKYFIVTYLPKYLDTHNSNSLLQKKINEYEEMGDIEVSKEAIDILSDYSINLRDVCKIYNKILKRRYNAYINSVLNLDEADRELSNDVKEWNKLPIELSFKDELIKFILQELSHYYDEVMINEIIKNSFKVDAIDSRVKLLKIEFEKSSDIYQAFNNIYKLYKSYSEILMKASSENNEMLTVNYVIDENEIERIGNITDKKKKLNELKKIELKKAKIQNSIRRNLFKDRKENSEYYNASKRLNFAKIMFLTFSKVRENYIRKKESVSLEQYLKNIAKNL